MAFDEALCNYIVHTELMTFNISCWKANKYSKFQQSTVTKKVKDDSLPFFW
jgi:hypothetical protein